jgi:hypothetical protein
MTGLTTHLSMVRNATYCGGFNRSTSLASICREKRALFFLPDLILTRRRSSLATKLHNGEVNRCRDGDKAARHARAEWLDLDKHYWRNKRYIAGGILVAKLLTTTVTTFIHAPLLDFS